MYSWNDWSIHAQLLGYMEQNPIYNAINFSYPPVASTQGGAAANTVLLIRINSFLCPSDPNAGPSWTNNYVGSMGTSIGYITQSQSSGLFAETVAKKIAAITDGTSNSVAFSERLVGTPAMPDHYPGNGMDGVSANANSPVNYYPRCLGGHARYIDLPAELQRGVANERDDQHGLAERRGELGLGDSGGHDVPDDRPAVLDAVSLEFLSLGLRASGCGVDSSHIVNATSRHPGGCNVLFADGSVRFVKSSVNMRTWMQLGTVAGGEVVSSDSY